MNYKKLESDLVGLFRDTACCIPFDIGQALIKARKKENRGSMAFDVFSVILENLRLAEAKQRPMCQDTGTPVFYVRFGKNQYDEKVIEAIKKATARATREVPLRANAVRLGDQKNLGTNLPEIHASFWSRPKTEIHLILKGGGSENVSRVFRIPGDLPGAGRDDKGIAMAALKAVFEAQGKGCSPGILGIAVGGSIIEAAENAKMQLLRKVGERSHNSQTADLEKKILQQCNQLGIGPLGLGGKTTLLDVFISDLSKSTRHPASFFVGISYMCYADRRGELSFSDSTPPRLRRNPKIAYPKYEPDFKKYKKINAPIKKDYKLKAGDRILLDGEITTARDRAHAYLLKEKKKLPISNVIYHCGILAGDCAGCLAAAGPTTSARLEKYENDLIKKYAIKAIIGKGGMRGLKRGTVYLEGFGGVGVLPARMMQIKNGFKKDFGAPEAIWNLSVGEPGMPLLVSIDGQGRNLYEEVQKKSENIYKKLIILNKE